MQRLSEYSGAFEFPVSFRASVTDVDPGGLTRGSGPLTGCLRHLCHCSLRTLLHFLWRNVLYVSGESPEMAERVS